ncbi:hypothetical protein APHWI1_0950 [Anaplasma phagocytophilum str. ApWI1]|uniref:Uncharacterized protein n=1 Tax=Anaplasma phagocytophilum str. ApWI1 TaxID=1359155 RepID=A0A0F3PVU8_ANAPH|nr:hypothetical protein APHWEB_0567 [Anaplasma phagocytophilum str. Webster]KJV83529.1 hypothetical protein APHHGE2_0177 [Anaplasma phagocytophilum str. HGE2]KJV84495.1 hypothetical protein APHWI1_0950 [Anaplasma phagocytophilum str. ApWI1]KJV86414.1 hypothetical protein APHNYW_1493 [Anaplasma phagocytophilum str. ApNYW]KJV99637.1 hypothetical protein OTSANNIE_0125 [Anaplasma phagocytophilum str. Annie]KJZ98880.1 hypothetical protein APHCR_0918 [Anaplasma phagocytophilum str. CR1007]
MLLLQSITVYHTCSDITKDSYNTNQDMGQIVCSRVFSKTTQVYLANDKYEIAVIETNT